MKKTNFTFFGTGKVYVIKALFLFFFFFTLSVGTEAQISALSGSSTLRGELVDVNTAQQRLFDHMDQLRSSNQSTPEAEVDVSVKLQYADYIFNGTANGSSFPYHVENSRAYLESLVVNFEPNYRPSVDELYNEMVDLLRS